MAAAKTTPAASEAIERTGEEPKQQITIRPSAPAGNQKTLKAFLEGPDIQKMLTDAIGKQGFLADDMTRMSLVAATKQPMLYKCTLASFLRALIDAAALGIMPGGLNGRGYLTPRQVKVVDKDVNGKEIERKEYQVFLDPGYRGFMDIARDSGQISTICAEVVREHDEFEYWYDPTPKLHFRPLLKGDRGEVVGAFALSQLKDGALQIEFLPRSDLDKIMGVSEAGKKGVGPWVDWYDQMARKSALRRLCKVLPVRGRAQERMEHAMMISDRADAGDPTIGQVIETTASETHDVANEVKAELSAKNETVDLFALESELTEVQA